MTAIDAARLAVNEGCQLLRPRKDEIGQYDAKHFADGGKKRGWFYLDSFSASAITQVYDALSPENQAKYNRLRIDKMAVIAFKLCSR